jgi:putative PIN family toxin of toxin-antitoxin system
MRLVLDTSVVTSAMRSRLGASNALVLRGLRGGFRMLATPPLFLEYEDVLFRPEQRLVHGLTIEKIDVFLSELSAVIEPVEIHYRWRPQVSDPGDEMVLEAAINGRADALVTHNIRHFAQAAPRFGLTVLTPKEALKEITR